MVQAAIDEVRYVTPVVLVSIRPTTSDYDRNYFLEAGVSMTEVTRKLVTPGFLYLIYPGTLQEYLLAHPNGLEARDLGVPDDGFDNFAETCRTLIAD